MVPEMMEQLLFDDILFGDHARREHDVLRNILLKLGIELLDVQELLEETLEIEAARHWLLEPMLDVTSRPVAERMQAAPAAQLASMLVHGVRVDPDHMWLESEELFEVPPLPNWCFQRDPQAIVGGNVIISAMATPVRWREAVIAGTLFRYHPRLSSVPILLDPLSPQKNRPIHMGPRRPHFEGGDLLVLSKDVIALGYSERTNKPGVLALARALSRIDDGPRWLEVLKLPDKRAFMHLDTVLTPIDRGTCLAYLPVLDATRTDSATAFEIDLHSEDLRPNKQDDFLSALRRRGLDYEPLACGGGDPMMQQREQWTDGANALAVAPGKVLLYDRNRETANELARAGYRVIESSRFLDDSESASLEGNEKICIQVPSHELSRARGGPHCLTHPLVRDDLD
jgi:arginine deiminase